MDKKAQHSRDDLLVWYVACFAIVLITVFSLYGLGIVGNSTGHGSLIESNKITAAAIAVPVEGPAEQIEEIQGNISLNSGNE